MQPHVTSLNHSVDTLSLHVKKCFYAFNSSSHSLGQSMDFISKQLAPYIRVLWPLEQLPVFQELSYFTMHDHTTNSYSTCRVYFLDVNQFGCMGIIVVSSEAKIMSFMILPSSLFILMTNWHPCHLLVHHWKCHCFLPPWL